MAASDRLAGEEGDAGVVLYPTGVVWAVERIAHDALAPIGRLALVLIPVREHGVVPNRLLSVTLFHRVEIAPADAGIALTRLCAHIDAVVGDDIAFGAGSVAVEIDYRLPEHVLGMGNGIGTRGNSGEVLGEAALVHCIVKGRIRPEASRERLRIAP